MSLSRVFSEEKTQKIIEVMPDEMIVWKVVCDPRLSKLTGRYNGINLSEVMTQGAWNSAFLKGDRDLRFYPFKNGWNTTNAPVGFHSFVQKGSCERIKQDYDKAIHDMNNAWRFISAKISKFDITVMGKDDNNYGICVITSQIIMPTYPNTDITKEYPLEQPIEEHEEVMELLFTPSERAIV